MTRVQRRCRACGGVATSRGRDGHPDGRGGMAVSRVWQPEPDAASLYAVTGPASAPDADELARRRP